MSAPVLSPFPTHRVAAPATSGKGLARGVLVSAAPTSPIASPTTVTDDTDWIAAHRHAWRRKACLRRYYEREIFARLSERLGRGRTLELGAGPGLFAEGHPEVVASDLSPGPCTAVVCDAHALPFADGAFANVVAIDTLHHLARPGVALAEAGRVLAGGGRLLLVEPWTGPFGRLVYRHLHHELCHDVPDPWSWAAPAGKAPMTGNAVIPKAVLADDGAALSRHAPGLRVTTVEPFGVVSFLMTGGFRSWGLPWPLARLAIAAEARLPRRLMAGLALRALFVVEKTGGSSRDNAQAAS